MPALHSVYYWEQSKPLMKRLTRWSPASFVRLSLAAVTLLTLMLALSGLMLTASAASAADPLKPLPRPPTRTPTPQPTSTPTPYPTATTAPRPTATAMPKATATTKPTAAATGTVLPDTSTDATGASPGKGASSLQPLLLWGTAAMMAALAIFGAGIWLFARRARRQGQQPAFASSAHTPSQERLNQLRQLLPARKASSPMPGEDEPKAAETSIAGEDTSPPWSSPPGPPWSPSPKPPQWLIEAGFFKGSAEERSPEGSVEERSPETPEKP